MKVIKISSKPAKDKNHPTTIENRTLYNLIYMILVWWKETLPVKKIEAATISFIYLFVTS